MTETSWGQEPAADYDVPPHDLLAEQSLLGAMMLSRTAIDDCITIIRSADFYRPAHSTIFDTIMDLHQQDEPVDAITVMNALNRNGEAKRTGGGTYLHTLIQGVPTAASAVNYARIVKDTADRRSLIASLTRGLQNLRSPVETGEILSRVMSDVSLIEAGIDPGMTTYGFSELMATPDEVRPWVIPSMLRRRERLIITGPEGKGKSVTVAQICLGAASGVSTLSVNGEGRHDPVRVLMVDVENDRLQIKANARKIWPYVREQVGADITPEIEWVDAGYLDLSTAVDQQRVIRLARERQPDLMYLGSVYRLAPAGEQSHQQFEWITRTVDRIRSETGSAILMEAHMGHGMSNDRNGGRPRGASEWMGWPEFGIGMQVSRDPSRPVELKHWRGARSDDRTWPAGMRRGAGIPWVPISDDEWQAVYATE